MKKLLKIVFAVIGLFLLLGFCAAIFSDTDDTSGTPKKVEETNATTDTAEETEEAPEEEEVIEDQVFSVGDKVDLDGTVVTVTNVEKNTGGEFDSPKQGNEYVIVTIRIENGSDETISYNPFDFELKNSNGNITDMTFTIIDTETALESGELATGGFVEGTVAFEAPEGDTGLQLIYTPNMFFDDKQILVNLQ